MTDKQPAPADEPTVIASEPSIGGVSSPSPMLGGTAAAPPASPIADCHERIDTMDIDALRQIAHAAADLFSSGVTSATEAQGRSVAAIYGLLFTV